MPRPAWSRRSARGGDEIAGHGRSNAERQGALPEAEEAALIAEATRTIAREEGVAPRGWLGPWISQSAATPDLLAEAGYRYLLDWCHDDQPVRMRTRAGSITALPYPQEINDIPQIVVRGIEAREFADMIVDAFNTLLADSARAPRVMGIALHAYIMGQPHRLPHLERALRHVAQAGGDRVWLTTAGAIVAHWEALFPRSDPVSRGAMAEPDAVNAPS